MLSKRNHRLHVWIAANLEMLQFITLSSAITFKCRPTQYGVLSRIVVCGNKRMLGIKGYANTLTGRVIKVH